jgi:DNA processing protein
MCGSGSGTGKTVRGRIMTEKEYLYLLLHAAGTGAVTAQRLYEHFGSYEHIWKAEKRELERSGLLSHGRLSGLLEARLREEELREDFAALEKRGLRFIAWWEEGYPGRLLPFRDRPAGLFVRGTLPAKDRFTAAIVGARSCTELGRQTAERLAFRLAEAGVQVISGLALGIDGAAHKGALEAGGKTFAVLGCGADRCYPRENYGLFKKMELQGGVLSEFVPGTSPLPMNFPMRNRIISGLSDAVILVEAREKSGSLITADLALEQGKEVFAVPGRITDPLSRGCNRLIQNGAAVCLGPEDVLEAFGIKFEKKTRADKKTEKRLAKNENMVYSFLDSRSGTLEEIMDACGLSVTETMECLLKLELMGMVQGNGDQYYCRKL